MAVSASAVFGDWLVFSVPESAQDRDPDGEGDASDFVLHVADLSALPPRPAFLRGDCNDDGGVIGRDAQSVPRRPEVGGFSTGSLHMEPPPTTCFRTVACAPVWR